MAPFFAVDAALSNKVNLFVGNSVASVAVDVIVVPVDHQLRPRGRAAKTLFGLAGKCLEEAVASKIAEQKLEPVPRFQTGDLRIITVPTVRSTTLQTRSFALCVAPDFSKTFQSAVETSLHTCFLRGLTAVAEKASNEGGRVQTVSFCPIGEGFETETVAHIGLRTARRFLERHGRALESITFCFHTQAHALRFNSVLPIYFPRSEEDLERQGDLKPDNGNGCVVHPSRGIAVSAGPGMGAASLFRSSSAEYANSPVNERSAPYVSSDEGLRVEIGATRTDGGETESHFTSYELEVREGSESYSVWRRYSDFVALREKIGARGNKWPFPAKRFFGSLDPECVEERRQGLACFIKRAARNERTKRHLRRFVRKERGPSAPTVCKEEIKTSTNSAPKIARPATVLHDSTNERPAPSPMKRTSRSNSANVGPRLAVAHKKARRGTASAAGPVTSTRHLHRVSRSNAEGNRMIQDMDL